MDTDKIGHILGRRSIRVYAPEDIPDETMETILAAAMAAPSACGKDPWRFIVVRERARLDEIARGLPNGKMIAKAPLGIVVCGDPEAAHDGQLGYLLQDCSAAMENLLLAAHALGLGACWLGVYPREERMDHLRRVLGIPSGIIPVAGVALGRPGEIKPPRTRYKADYIHHESW